MQAHFKLEPSCGEERRELALQLGGPRVEEAIVLPRGDAIAKEGHGNLLLEQRSRRPLDEHTGEVVCHCLRYDCVILRLRWTPRAMLLRALRVGGEGPRQDGIAFVVRVERRTHLQRVLTHNGGVEGQLTDRLTGREERLDLRREARRWWRE